MGPNVLYLQVLFSMKTKLSDSYNSHESIFQSYMLKVVMLFGCIRTEKNRVKVGTRWKYRSLLNSASCLLPSEGVNATHFSD